MEAVIAVLSHPFPQFILFILVAAVAAAFVIEKGK